MSTARAGEIAYWTGNGTTADSSGNGHTATLNGAGYEPGRSGQAFAIPYGSYVSAAPSPAWGFGANDFSINLWAEFDSYNLSGPGQLSNTFIGQDGGGGDTDKWVFYLTASGTQGNLGFHINGPDAGGIQFLSAPADFALTTGQWNMYTITRSGDTYTFYYNGMSVGTDTSSLLVPFSGTDLTMGEAEGIGWINGGMQDVGIYNTALTPAQVKALATPEPAPVCVVSLALLGLARRRRSK